MDKTNIDNSKLVEVRMHIDQMENCWNDWNEDLGLSRIETNNATIYLKNAGNPPNMAANIYIISMPPDEFDYGTVYLSKQALADDPGIMDYDDSEIEAEEMEEGE